MSVVESELICEKNVEQKLCVTMWTPSLFSSRPFKTTPDYPRGCWKTTNHPPCTARCNQRTFGSLLRETSVSTQNKQLKHKFWAGGLLLTFSAYRSNGNRVHVARL